MKTLDEVIKANECCDHGETDSRCEDCPYNGIGSCCLERENDALHYLKEYRARDRMSRRIDLEDNAPLTWDELREMEGKPVWVEMEGYKPKWGIVMNQDERNGRLLLCGYDEMEIRIEINEEGEGKGWQAYRKEHNGVNS